MLPALLSLKSRVRLALRQVAVASGAGALVLAGLSLIGAAGIVWLSARYGVLVALCAAGGGLVLCGLVVFLVARPRPAAAVAEAAPAMEAAALSGGVRSAVGGAVGGDVLGPAFVGHAGTALRAARAALPAGSGAAIAGAVTSQIARRPVKAVAAAVAVGAVLGVLRAARREDATYPQEPDA